MKVLIIDDDPILIMVCTRLMKITGFSEEVMAAREGKEAIEKLRALIGKPEDELPKLILLDINMPVMNGWEFLAEYLRIIDQFSKIIPVFMLSSTIDQADFDKAKTYHVVKGFYSKPLTKDNLFEIEGLVKA
jgi:CheY-like chemotaxis protein